MVANIVPKSRAADDIAGPGTGTGRDVGVLILRVFLALVVGAHGLQKLFGVFDGPGIAGFAQTLTGYGFTSQTTLLAWVTGLSEAGGSLLLLLGLFTPLGGAAVLGVAMNIVYVRFGTGFFMSGRNGFEFQLILGAVALALMFTGAGRYSLDRGTVWNTRPERFGLAALALSLVTSAAVIVLFR